MSTLTTELRNGCACCIVSSAALESGRVANRIPPHLPIASQKFTRCLNIVIENRGLYLGTLRPCHGLCLPFCCDRKKPQLVGRCDARVNLRFFFTCLAPAAIRLCTDQVLLYLRASMTNVPGLMVHSASPSDKTSIPPGTIIWIGRVAPRQNTP